jgi:hypothetical protein
MNTELEAAYRDIAKLREENARLTRERDEAATDLFDRSKEAWKYLHERDALSAKVTKMVSRVEGEHSDNCPFCLEKSSDVPQCALCNLEAGRESLAAKVKDSDRLRPIILRVLDGAGYYGAVDVSRGPADDRWLAWRQDLVDLHSALQTASKS